MSKRSRHNRGSSSRSQRENLGDTVLSWSMFEDDASTAKYAELLYHQIDSGAVIDWNFLRNQGLEQAFLQCFQTDAFTGPQWERLFRVREPIYNELVREFFVTFQFDLAEARNDVMGTTLYFRLGGEQRTCSVESLVGGWVCTRSMRRLRMGFCVGC